MVAALGGTIVSHDAIVVQRTTSSTVNRHFVSTIASSRKIKGPMLLQHGRACAYANSWDTMSAV